MKLKNLQQLPDEARKKAEPYFTKMLALYPDEIVCMAIYGSAAGQNYVPGISDINSTVVFKDFDYTHLRRALRLVNEGIAGKISAPLFLTPAYIESSLDVFPMEFLDIKENHILIYGEDIFSPLKIDMRYLRLFCEQQIKGRLIRVRQAYLEIGLRRKGIEALIKESLTSLFPVFRNLVRLKGAVPSVEKNQLIAQMAEHYGVDGNLLSMIYKDKTNDEKIGGRDIDQIFERYIALLKALWQKVDAL